MAYSPPKLPPALRTGAWGFDPTGGTIVTDFQAGHGYTTSGADASSNVNDTSQFVAGSQCATVVSAGNGASAILQNTTAVSSTDTTNLQVIVVLKCDDTTHLSSINFSMGNSGFTNEYHVSFASQVRLASGAWIVVSLSLGDAATQGSPTRTGITSVRGYFKDDNTGNKVTVHWQGIWFMPNAATQPGAPFPNGLASICFDDGFASQWNIAKPYLDRSGLRASAYAIKDEIGLSGRLTVAQLQSMQDQSGWEIGCHAYTDADHGATYPGLTTEQLFWDIGSEKEWMLVNGLSGQGHAYPLGAANPSVVSVIRQYVRYSRGTQSLTETYPPGDPYRLKSWSGISEFTGGTSPASISQVGGKIDQAVTNASWLILTFHNIIPAVSSVTMSGNVATIVFAGTLPTVTNWQSGSPITLAGFTPSGLNGNFTIASVVNSTTITVNIGSNPGNSTVQGTATTSTTDCSYGGFTAIIDKLISSGIRVLPVAEAFTGGQQARGAPSFPVPISQGGHGKTTQPAALTALAGTQSSGKYLRSDGANTTLAVIQAADLPTLDAIATAAPPAAAVAINNQKLTALLAGASATDAANVGQIPTPWGPADQGYVAWTRDADGAQGSTTALATAGLLYTFRLSPLLVATNIGTIDMVLTANGGTLTTGQCFIAVYTPAGALLGQSADQSSAWGSGASKTVAMALTGGPFSCPAGHPIVAVWFNGTTGPSFLRFGSGNATINIGTTTAKYGTANSGVTTTAPSTLGAISTAGTAYFVGAR